MNPVVLILLIVVIAILGFMFMKSQGGSAPTTDTAANGGAEAKAKLLDSIPADVTMPRVIGCLAVAAIAMFLWAKLPKFRYVFIGLAIMFFYVVLGGPLP